MEPDPKTNGELAKLARDLLDRVSGLVAVYVSDSYGVPLVQASTESSENVNDETARVMSATFSVALDQVGKLQLGKSESIVSFYSNLVVVHINHHPLVISFFLEETEEANVGLLLSLGQDLKKVLEPLRKAVAQMDNESSTQRD